MLKLKTLIQFLKLHRRGTFSFLLIAGALIVSAYLVFGGTEIPKRSDFLVNVQNSDSQTNKSPGLNFAPQVLSNLTAQFADEALQNLIQANQNLVDQGIKDVSQTKLTPDKTDVEKVISQIIEDEASSEKINPAELFVSNDNSKPAQAIYLFMVDQIIKNKMADISVLDPNAASSLTDYFSQVATNFSDAVELLKALSVPSNWLQIHTQIIEFFARERNIYRSLAAAEEDPIRFLIATYKILPLEAEKEFSQIREQINQKMKDEKLI